MIDEDYNKLVTDKFNEYLNLLLRRDVRGVVVVIVDNDLLTRSDTFGIPDVSMIGALDYAKHRILELNSKIPFQTDNET
jgi:hypothetical protein